jgi:hypothetical protein
MAARNREVAEIGISRARLEQISEALETESLKVDAIRQTIDTIRQTIDRTVGSEPDEALLFLAASAAESVSDKLDAITEELREALRGDEQAAPGPVTASARGVGAPPSATACASV